jgi:hypothetical protein
MSITGNKWTGAYLNAHTNLTEIEMALDLLWRNDIRSDQVVLGLAFYGRAFTVESTSCTYEPLHSDVNIVANYVNTASLVAFMLLARMPDHAVAKRVFS